MNSNTVRMSLHLSDETNKMLENLCEDHHLTKSDFLRKSIALMQVALRSKREGNHLIVVDDKDKRISEIIGL